jgi:hypothetical protein
MKEQMLTYRESIEWRFEDTVKKHNVELDFHKNNYNKLLE